MGHSAIGVLAKVLIFRSNLRMPQKKKSIFNDPIYGFITVQRKIIFQLVQHPWFQRLRRIHQLGLTNLVYSGANHTRFHHCMGATHLMEKAITTLKSKGVDIDNKEARAVTIAILLHDIGHGPFSHALEHSIVDGVSHEDLSAIFMDRLNEQFDGKLELAIKIFDDNYEKPFLHQLVSSQLDMDRLDYLKRDSFFTGVYEGAINSERIISLLNVHDGHLAVDAKGIYSMEHFIIARRLMYWQVYLHKTVLAAEFLLMRILKRAKELADVGEKLFATPMLQHFLYNHFTRADFMNEPELADMFTQLDDHDIMASIKAWVAHPDKVLSRLCDMLIDRRLYKVVLSPTPIPTAMLEEKKERVVKALGISESEAEFFVFTDAVRNNAYDPQNDRINILLGDGSTQDLSQAADLLNIEVLSKPVEKHLMCYLNV